MKLLSINILFVLFIFDETVSSFDFIKKYTYCKLTECCNEDYVIGNFSQLGEDLDIKLYGQHIAKQVVLNALISHWHEEFPQKALTMSFHGWPGSGKNYVAKFIKDALYKEGGKSKYVHDFSGRIHFPSSGNLKEQQENLQNWIKGNVSQCARSLFIFDETDKMPAGLLNALKPMIDYHDFVDRVDYRRAIFIFLSNTGGNLINAHLLYLWGKGVERDNVNLNDFEKIIADGAFNEEGGFHQSDTIKNSLIDHYIPFFPLEKRHVELCIKDQFKLRRVSETRSNHIEEVMNYVEWGPPENNIFSKTGCKRISQKVALVIQKYRLRRDEL